MRSQHYYTPIIDTEEQFSKLFKEAKRVSMCRYPSRNGRNSYSIHIDYESGASILRVTEQHVEYELPARLLHKLRKQYIFSEEKENNMYYNKPRFFSEITAKS